RFRLPAGRPRTLDQGHRGAAIAFGIPFRLHRPAHHRPHTGDARPYQGGGLPARRDRRRHAARPARAGISWRRWRRVMNSRSASPMTSQPELDGPPPFTTLVELTWREKRIEHWIRFGRQSYE